MSTNSHQARETIKHEKRAGTLINASGRESTKAAIFLDNGSIIASPLSVTRLMNAIERSNAKSASLIGGTKANETVRLRVYDAADEPPKLEMDEYVPEVEVESDEVYAALNKQGDNETE